MTRLVDRLSLLALSALLTLSCGHGDDAASGTTVSSQPPVIVVSIDTTRQDRLGVYGARSVNSPYLDKLAQEAVVFDDCVSQSSNTGPSHRSLFTGQFVHRHRHSMYEPMHSPYTMAGLFREAGYETAAFTGGGFLSKGLGFEDGFDLYMDRDDNLTESYRRGFATTLPQVRRWWQARDASRPFFLFLHSYDVHCPYWPAEPWRSQFGSWYEGTLDLRKFCGREVFDKAFKGPDKLSVDDLNYVNNMYDGGIAMADSELGGFLDGLRADGTLDRSVLVIMSDHGESLGDKRAYLGHNRLWEEQLKVPLMIRFPRAQYGGMRVKEPVMLIDVLPTLLDYLGRPIPEGVQGESLLPILRGEKSYDGQRLRISQHLDRLAFRFDQQWKVHLRQTEGGKARVKLFDLQADPDEHHDLLQDPKRAKEARKTLDDLIERFQAWRAATRDDDARFRGTKIQAPMDPSVAKELGELGYVGFDEDDSPPPAKEMQDSKQ